MYVKVDSQSKSPHLIKRALPFLSRPNLKITERSYSATTFMQVQSEKGSVTITRSKAKPVKTMAQNPGPSGSAERKERKENSMIAESKRNGARLE